MTRRRILLAVIVAALLLGVGALTLSPPRSTITRGAFEQIELGMEDGDVLAMLGAPGDYGVDPFMGHKTEQTDSVDGIKNVTLNPASYREWFADEIGIITISDDRGRVAEKYLVSVNRQRHDSVFARIKRLIGH
jgi:hypothetical protein